MIEGEHTEHGVFLSTPIRDVIPILRNHVEGKRFLDLGSGLGKIVNLAQMFGANAFGVEIEKELAEKSHCKNKILNYATTNNYYYLQRRICW